MTQFKGLYEEQPPILERLERYKIELQHQLGLVEAALDALYKSPKTTAAINAISRLGDL